MRYKRKHPMNSRRKQSGDFLGTKLTPKRAERLLIDWVNIAVEYPWEATPATLTAEDAAQIKRTDDAIAWLIKRRPEVFPPVSEWSGGSICTESTLPVDAWVAVAHVQEFLRLAWNASDLRTREWYIFKARDCHYCHKLAVTARLGYDCLTVVHPTGVHPPPLTPFEQAMYHFQRIAQRARHCANADCPAPYFFASKKAQKYCSERCAAPAHREQKRRWWRENRSTAKEEKTSGTKKTR